MYSEFKYYSCPGCGEFVVNYPETGSFHHTSVDFSDGKNRSMYSFSDLKITKCYGCEKNYWLREEYLVGIYDYGKKPLSNSNEERNKELIRKIPNWEKVKSADLPSVLGFDELLKAGDFRNEDEELYLRQNLHWAFNDKYIFEDRMFHNNAEKVIWEDNLKSLIPLIKNKWGYRLYLAELYRNLGRFLLAKLILAFTITIYPNQRKTKSAIFKACKNKNRMVVPVSA